MYSIKEAFYTIQGEGYHAGSAAVFVRFTGCNIWSGREQDRERDSAKGNCARWCDTDFRGTDGARGGRYSAEGVAKLVRELWPNDGPATVVLTGGEPLLQVDMDLISELKRHSIRVHVESNGSIAEPKHRSRPGIDWLTVSPKPPTPVAIGGCDEIKLVFAPGVDPTQYEKLAPNLFLQPLWLPDSEARAAECSQVVEYVKKNPQWRVSVQTHKVLGIQ